LLKTKRSFFSRGFIFLVLLVLLAFLLAFLKKLFQLFFLSLKKSYEFLFLRRRKNDEFNAFSFVHFYTEEDSTVVSLIVLTEEWQKQDGKLAKHFTTAQPVALEVKRSYS
jgi:hypothetical protein